MNWNEIPNLQSINQVDLDNYITELQVLHTDIPVSMLKYYFVKAAREFAERSKSLLRRVEVKLQPCVTHYPIDLPEHEEFDSLQGKREDAYGNGSYTECGRYYVKWDVPFHQLVVALPEPKEATSVFILVSTTPIQKACVIDEAFLKNHGDDVTHGAWAHLFRMSGENVTWTDLGLSREHERIFSGKVTDAGINRLMSNSSGRIQLKPRRTM